MNYSWFTNIDFDTIIDIGANEGQFASNISSHFPHATFYCFEPLPEPFKGLSKRFGGLDRFHLYDLALGNESGKKRMFRNEYSLSSSILPMAEAHKEAFTNTKNEFEEYITIDTLDNVFKKIKIKGPILVKIDVQGFEKEVIKGGQKIISKADMIILETSFVPLYKNAPLFGDIYESLKNLGFNYQGSFDQLPSPQDGRILQQDSIFVRDDSVFVKNMDQGIAIEPVVPPAVEDLDTVKSQLLSKTEELSKVYSSRGWKLVISIRRVLNALVPRGSLRRRIVAVALRSLRAPLPVARVHAKTKQLLFNRKNVLMYRRVCLQFLKVFFFWIPRKRSRRKKILIVRADNVGDFIVFSAALKYIRSMYKDYEISFLNNENVREMAGWFPEIDRYIPFDIDRFRLDPIYYFKIFWMLRRESFRMAINPMYSRSYIGDELMRMTISREKIGFDGDTSSMHGYEGLKTKNDRIYTRLVESPSIVMPEIERYSILIKSLGYSGPIDMTPVVDVRKEWLVEAKKILLEGGVGNDRYVVVHMGAYNLARIWPLDGFVKVTELLVGKGYAVVFTGTEKEKYLFDEIDSRCHSGTLVNLMGKTTLSVLAGVLKGATLYFGAETGTLHIAASVGCKTLCLLGGGHFGRFFPYGDPRQNKYVYDKDMKCKNDNWVCTLEKPGAPAPCIKGIKVDDAIHELRSILDTYPEANATIPLLNKNQIISTKNNPKISVITPSYNSGQHIERAIKSVLMQDYKNWEHIIVDGGSNDETIDTLKKYRHIKWISEPDKGQTDAMSKGFRMSSGDVVVYLNADDYFFRGAFTAAAEAFAKGAVFVVGNLLVKSPRQQAEFVSVPRITLEGMLRHWEPNAFPANPVSYFYLREVQEACPLNIDNYAGQDLEFLLDAAAKYTFTKVEKTFGCMEDTKDTKTGVTQSKLDYWRTDMFPYLYRHVQSFSPEWREAYRKDQLHGYSEVQAHMNRLIYPRPAAQPRGLPSVSVVMPSYNCIKYISRAVDSVLIQGLDNVEVIIDDSSTDGTLELLQKKYGKNPSVRILKDETHHRQGASRNACMDIAKGKYLLFLDADDWIDKGALPDLISIAEEYKADIVGFGALEVSEDGGKRILHSRAFSTTGGREALEYFSDYYIGSIVWNKLYSRSFLENNKLRFEASHGHEDVLFTTRAVYLSKKYISIAKTYYNYFKRSGSLTVMTGSPTAIKQNRWHLESYLYLYINMAKFAGEIGLMKDESGRSLASRLIHSHCSKDFFPKLAEYKKSHSTREWELDCYDVCEKMLGPAGFSLADFIITAMRGYAGADMIARQHGLLSQQSILRNVYRNYVPRKLKRPIKKIYEVVSSSF